MAANYWVVKQEPESYAWTAFVAEGSAVWAGVRNYQARNNLRAMKRGDPVVYYHSGEEKMAVGLAQVKREAYTDPTAKEGDWSAVDLVPVKPLVKSVLLVTMKADKILSSMALVRNSRLSVSPLTASQFERLMTLAETAA